MHVCNLSVSPRLADYETKYVKICCEVPIFTTCAAIHVFALFTDYHLLDHGYSSAFCRSFVSHSYSLTTAILYEPPRGKTNNVVSD